MAKLTTWVLEHRFTKGLDLDRFANQLALPIPSDLAQRLKLNDVQKWYQWRQRGAIPWAVYLAILDRFGTPKFHEPPTQERVRTPVRLPKHFASWVQLDALPPPAPPTPAPAPLPVPNFQVPALTPTPQVVTLRVELITPPAPIRIQQVDLNPLLERLAELEGLVADLQAQASIRVSEAHGVPVNLDHQARKQIRMVAKQDPKLARELAHQLAHR